MRRLLRQEDGIALPLAMIMLLILTLMSLTYMSLGAVEPQISQNLADGKRAFYLAESGIEVGFNMLIGKNFNDVTLLGGGLSADPDCNPRGTSCRVLAKNLPLPGGDVSGGTISITLRNDVGAAGCPAPPAVTAADQMRIGCGTTPDTSATVDSNNIVFLSAVGRFGSASRMVTAVIQGKPPLAITAALTLQNSPTVFYFLNCGVGCNLIDGRDWRAGDVLDPPTGVKPMLLGIATTAEATTEAAFDTAARSGCPSPCQQKRNSVTGAGQTSATQSQFTTGLSTIALRPLSFPAMDAFLSWASAKIGVTTAPAGGRCAATTGDLYCNGDANGGMITGSGILVVTGTLYVSGTFRWTGLIVAGAFVAVPGDNFDVRGAMILTLPANQIPAGSGANSRAAGTAIQQVGNSFIVKYCAECIQVVTMRGVLEVVNP